MKVAPLLFLFACAIGLRAQGPEVAGQQVARPGVWSASFVEAMASLPVQDGGRVKPLSALAATTLHMVHGRRDMKLDLDGNGKPDVTLTPIEWLLEVWCFPEQAGTYPLFRIENVDVLDAIGIRHDSGQRFDFEYVSFATMVGEGRAGQPAQRLMDLAHTYAKKKESDRSGLESHVVNTAEQLNAYFALHQQMDLLRGAFQLEGPELQARLGGERIDFSTLISKVPEYRALIREYADKLEDPAIGNAVRVGMVLDQIAKEDVGAALFPPADDSARWLGFGGVVDSAVKGELQPGQFSALQSLQRGIGAEDQTARERELLAFREAVVARATERGEYGRVELEASYLAVSWHYKALHFFLVALVIVAGGWMAPRQKWLWLAGIVATSVPLVLLVVDIVLRCVIRGRPPILNLYDTFLFIAAVGVTSAVVAEVIVRRRFIISLAPIFGALVVALARAFEVEDGKDEMAPLQAVLDTNYYLATHVTSINIGYAAGMFASLVGTLWLLLQAFGVLRNDTAFHKSIVRATYGLVAFGLIFAVFGTIYGGVWANDSWGRFWGWDPKENGALLICIAQVALLHARFCGWVRDFGFCLGAALTGIIVAFSWFHVNLLQIGLHSYGFSGSTKTALFTYYGVQLLLIAVGSIGVLMRRAQTAAALRAAALPATE